LFNGPRGAQFRNTVGGWNYSQPSDVGQVQQYHPAGDAPAAREGVRVMLNWVVTFLIIALVAALLGFGGIAGAAIEIAKVIFFIAILLFVIAVIVGLIGRGGRGYAP
jgi:uncharacterized membrane protein YtjA (UPF0391 family)